jgi:hypothetical protein
LTAYPAVLVTFVCANEDYRILRLSVDVAGVEPPWEQQVPEPAALSVFGLGLLGIAALRRRRRA